MQWQKESIPIRPHWGQKASREVGPKQTLTNGNCKAKENDELNPPATLRETPEEQSNRTICLPLFPLPRLFITLGLDMFIKDKQIE